MFFVVIAKFGITICWNIVSQVGMELFPTVLRVTGCGVAGTIARIVGSLAPFVAYSAAVFYALPTLIMSALALAAAIVVFFLPETIHHTLPETVEDIKKQGLQVGLKTFARNITCRCLKKEKAEIRNDSLPPESETMLPSD